MNSVADYRKVFACVLLTLLSFYPLSPAIAEQEKDHDHEESEEASPISAADLDALGAEVAVAGPGTIARTISLPGEVKLNSEAVARISPRYAAQLVTVSARVGDTVEAGETLAEAENSQTLQRFPLRSLIDGTVIQREVVLGDQIQPSEVAFVVADLSTLWVDIALYPQDLAQVRSGQAARLSTTFGPEPTEVHIDYVSPSVSEVLRTGMARVFLDNTHGEWRPGMFVQADVVVATSEVDIAVPHSAVIEYEGNTVVFVQEGDQWHPRTVELGQRGNERVAVQSGLQVGDTYLAKGGFMVKADLQKNEFESGHNH